MAFIIHYSHATCTFADHHVLRAVVENECFRPDLTVFNHWETAVTKKSVVFVPLYTLCGKVQNYTEGLQVICRQFAPWSITCSNHRSFYCTLIHCSHHPSLLLLLSDPSLAPPVAPWSTARIVHCSFYFSLMHRSQNPSLLLLQHPSLFLLLPDPPDRNSFFPCPNYNAVLLVNVSVVLSFPGSKNPSPPLPRKPPDFYSTL